jgi:hypothetical protein
MATLDARFRGHDGKNIPTRQVNKLLEFSKNIVTPIY